MIRVEGFHVRSVTLSGPSPFLERRLSNAAMQQKVLVIGLRVPKIQPMLHCNKMLGLATSKAGSEQSCETFFKSMEKS